MSAPVPFRVTEGVASNGVHSVSCPDPGGRVFMRRAIKGLGSAHPQPVEWAVAELDGVRAYFDGVHVVLTRRDLLP